MLKSVLFTLATTSLLFTACSSSDYPDSAENLAQEVCKVFKTSKLDGILPFLDNSPASMEKFNKNKPFLIRMMASDEMKKVLQALDCSHSTEIKKYTGYDKYHFGTMMKVKVVNVDGLWKTAI